MWDKVSNYFKWQKAQAQFQKQLEQIFATAEKGGIKVVVRGDKRIERIEVDGIENKVLKDAINEAMKEITKKSEKQLRGKMGEMDLPWS